MAEIVRYNVPFFSQRFPLGKDKWEGFKTKEDMEYWEKRACGLVCLKMLIKYFCDEDVPVGTLFTQAMKLNSFCDRGWIHSKLAELAKRYELRAVTGRNITNEEIKGSLENGNICIASVAPGIETSYNKTGFEKSGHLMLLTGYKEDDGVIISFYVNHSSTKDDYNWSNKEISYKRFNEHFSRNVIFINR